MRGLIIGVLLCIAIGQSLALVGTYTHSSQLHPKYLLRWKISGDEIHIALEVQTLGWVGFGLAEPTSGSMPGADIVTAYVDNDGKVEVHDRHAIAKVLPEVDTCQDWLLVSGVESNGKTIVELRRKLHTNDTQDREIFVPSADQLARRIQFRTRIVFAFGSNDNVAYHENNRGATTVNFFEVANPSQNPDPLVTTADYIMKNASIPASTTTYMCQTYLLPSDVQHVIKIEPLIDPVGAPYVHHFGVIVCPVRDTWFNDRLNNPKNCYVGGRSSCSYTIWGWGPGSGPLELPSNVGFKSGNGTGMWALNLQIHYDNPLKLSGLFDNSGFRIHYTKNFRTYDAGALTVGDPFVSAKDIPPRQAHWGYEHECSRTCTSTWPHPINVFAQWMHMHMAASQAFTTYHRQNDTEEYQFVSQVDFWDFGFQQTLPLHDILVVAPGDRLNVHCIYNTLDRNTSTPFFIGSHDEMCVQILYYYPALPNMANCGSYVDETNINATRQISVCGNVNNQINETNPMYPDPVGLDAIEFGVAPASSDECLPIPVSTVADDEMSVAVQTVFSFKAVVGLVFVTLFSSFYL